MSDKNLIVIEVSGGVVQNVAAINPNILTVVLVDWDNIEEGAEPGSYPIGRLNDLTTETLEAVAGVLHGKA